MVLLGRTLSDLRRGTSALISGDKAVTRHNDPLSTTTTQSRLHAHGHTLLMASKWWCKSSSSTLVSVNLSSGLRLKPISCDRSNQWRSRMPEFRRPVMIGMFGLNASICVVTAAW
jgi:hypothetical protein